MKLIELRDYISNLILSRLDRGQQRIGVSFRPSKHLVWCLTCIELIPARRMTSETFQGCRNRCELVGRVENDGGERNDDFVLDEVAHVLEIKGDGVVCGSRSLREPVDARFVSRDFVSRFRDFLDDVGQRMEVARSRTGGTWWGGS